MLLVAAGLVVATTPFDRTIGLDVQFLRTPAAATGLLFMALYLVLSRGRFRFHTAAQLWAVVFLIVVGTMELLRLAFADLHAFVGVPSLTLVAARYLSWAQPVILFLLVSMVARDRRSIGFVLSSFPFVMAGLALGAIAVAGSSRWAPVGLNANAAGVAFGMGVVIAVALLLRGVARNAHGLALAYGASAVLCLIGVASTGSRGASAATVAALCVLVLLSSFKLRQTLILLVMLIAVGVASGPYLQDASGLLLSRWQQALEGTQLGARDQLITVSAQLFRESPMWGYGLQATQLVGERYYALRGEPTRGPISPHNTVFAILVPFGLLGSFAWFAMVASGCVVLWRHRRMPEGALLLALLALFFVYTVGGNITGNKLFNVVLGLAVCIPFWVSKNGDVPREERSERG